MILAELVTVAPKVASCRHPCKKQVLLFQEFHSTEDAFLYLHLLLSRLRIQVIMNGLTGFPNVWWELACFTLEYVWHFGGRPPFGEHLLYS